MSFIFTFLIIFISFSTYANTYNSSDLPDAIICQANSNNQLLQKPFIIHGLKNRPWLDNLDARSEGPIDMDGFLIIINANNGCDNNYEIAIITEDLVALALKLRSQANGIMRFSNSESVCTDSDCNLSESASVICHL